MTENHFATLWALGYHRLVPIIPPDAEISEKSSLAKRKDARGKAVGVKGKAGPWFGLDWIPYEADEQDVTRWHAMGAGVGIKTGQGLVGIDADTLDHDCARMIRDIVEDHVGRVPVRIGNYPKALYLVRVEGEYRYTRVEFGARRENGTLTDRVEILSDGRQFVAHGVHPTTLKPYHWPRALVPYSDLPIVTPGQLDAMLAAIRDAMPQAAPIVREGATTNINQDTLKGDLGIVTKAVRATPNTSGAFPSREAYRDYGYAIKAALPNDQDAAFELYADWCARWTDGENDPDIVAADWQRMKPPYRRGASWLYDLAERHGEGKFNPAEAWFEPIPEDTNPFAVIAQQAVAQPVDAPPIAATLYAFPPASSITPRQWIYANHYIRKFVSATVAPSGVGKSSLEIVEALAMTSGKPLLGKQPHGKSRVWLWNGEDPRDELDRRITAAMLHYGITPEDIGDRLFVDSGRDMEIVLAAEGRDGARIATPVVAAVMATLKANNIDVLQIDPFVSSHRVSENDNGAIDLVTKQWSKIADACNCAIELVHHVRKLNGGEVTVEDSRGAVSLIATSRSARALAKMSPKEGMALGVPEGTNWRYFRFGDGKNNLAPPAGERAEWMEMRSVGLGNGWSSLVAHGEAAFPFDGSGEGDFVGVVCEADVRAAASLGVDTDAVSQSSALRMIAEGEWRRDVRAGDAWVGVPIGRALGLDYTDPDDKKRLNAVISRWIDQGILSETSKKDAQRKVRSYVEVAIISDKPSESVFD